MAYEYKLGATEIGMELLTDLGIRAAPHPGYQPYAAPVKLGDGNLRGQGFPVVSWHWAFVSIAERAVFVDMLDAGALSGEVFIRTRLTDGTWHDFSCVMNMPTGEEDLQSGRIINFDITFTHCEEV